MANAHCRLFVIRTDHDDNLLTFVCCSYRRYSMSSLTSSSFPRPWRHDNADADVYWQEIFDQHMMSTMISDSCSIVLTWRIPSIRMLFSSWYWPVSVPWIHRRVAAIVRTLVYRTRNTDVNTATTGELTSSFKINERFRASTWTDARQSTATIDVDGRHSNWTSLEYESIHVIDASIVLTCTCTWDNGRQRFDDKHWKAVSHRCWHALIKHRIDGRQTTYTSIAIRPRQELSHSTDGYACKRDETSSRTSPV
jgi:hypothetical protein